MADLGDCRYHDWKAFRPPCNSDAKYDITYINQHDYSMAWRMCGRHSLEFIMSMGDQGVNILPFELTVRKRKV